MSPMRTNTPQSGPAAITDAGVVIQGAIGQKGHIPGKTQLPGEQIGERGQEQTAFRLACHLLIAAMGHGKTGVEHQGQHSQHSRRRCRFHQSYAFLAFQLAFHGSHGPVASKP